MSELVPVASLELHLELYPRNKVNDHHVSEILGVMEGGHELPPIIVWRKNNWIVDGAHRWTAAVKKSVDEIAVEWRDYASDEEFFRDACLLNSGAGLNFSSLDKRRIMEIGQQFGLKELDFAGLLRTSPSYIRALMPRVGFVAPDPDQPLPKSHPVKQQKVPLKASVRHLSGQTITQEQADAIKGNAPGTPYLLLIRQLMSALRNDLLPPPDQHPVMWEELRQLSDMLNAAL